MSNFNTSSYISENLIDAFHLLSKNKEYGDLRVSSIDSALLLKFQNGEVIGFSPRGKTFAKDVFDLIRLSLPNQKIGDELAPHEHTTLAELKKSLVGSEVVEEVNFHRAEKAIALESFYDLGLDLSVACAFKKAAKITEYKTPHVYYPMHLLLDLREQVLVKLRFKEIFHEKFDYEKILISKVKNNSANLLENEYIIISNLSKPKKIKNLQDESLLCSLDFNKSLLSLYDLGLIEVKTDVNANSLQAEKSSKLILEDDAGSLASNDILAKSRIMEASKETFEDLGDSIFNSESIDPEEEQLDLKKIAKGTLSANEISLEEVEQRARNIVSRQRSKISEESDDNFSNLISNDITLKTIEQEALLREQISMSLSSLQNSIANENTTPRLIYFSKLVFILCVFGFVPISGFDWILRVVEFLGG